MPEVAPVPKSEMTGTIGTIQIIGHPVDASVPHHVAPRAALSNFQKSMLAARLAPMPRRATLQIRTSNFMWSLMLSLVK